MGKNRKIKANVPISGKYVQIGAKLAKLRQIGKKLGERGANVSKMGTGANVAKYWRIR
jgi:hypothetical protein